MGAKINWAYEELGAGRAGLKIQLDAVSTGRRTNWAPSQLDAVLTGRRLNWALQTGVSFFLAPLSLAPLVLTPIFFGTACKPFFFIPWAKTRSVY